MSAAQAKGFAPPGPEPDWQRIRAICDAAQRLRDGPGLTKADFDRLFDEAKKACNGHTEFLEALAPYRPTS
jgi:hypothetical protein